MNYLIFDTETISIDKPYCYNIGYVIINENGKTLVEKDFIVEQIWHNAPLFASAYYANKRSIYIGRMKSKKTRMNKYGFICREMKRDIEKYEVKIAYAYNSSFDERVFNFNSNWFNCINPIEDIKVSDIRGFALEYLVKDEYQNFCEENELFTESGNYSTTAESMFRFISNNLDFIEEHTALADSQIEKDILMKCIKLGASFEDDYKAKKSIVRNVKRTLHLNHNDKDYYFDYNRIRMSKDKTELVLK